MSQSSDLSLLLGYADLRQRFFGEDRNSALIHAASVKAIPGIQTEDEAFAVAVQSLLTVDEANARWIRV
jgi:hypothetical protein